MNKNSLNISNKKIKRILFFIPFGLETSGGAERVLTTLVNNLIKDKMYEIDIISYNKTQSFYKLSSKVNLLDLNFKNSKNFVLKKIKPLSLLFILKKIILKNNYSYIVTLGEDVTILISLLRLPENIKKVTWIHNSIFQKTYKVLKLLRYFAYKKMDKIVMINSTDTKVYTKVYGEKVIFIPNPIIKNNKFLNNFTNHEEKVKKQIISVGRLSRVKDFKTAIEIFSYIEKKYPEWKYKIIGKDEGEKVSLLNLIKNLNLKNVEIISESTNIFKEYEAADFLLVTSINESFSMVILEARSIGVPTIAFDCDSGPRDLIINGYNGFLIKDRNKKELLKSIEILITNKILLNKFKENSLENLEKYNVENIVQIWKNKIFK